MQEEGGGSVKKCRCFCAAPRRGGPRLSSGGFCSAEVFQQIEGIRAETRIPSGTSGPVSRVLSFKTAIYLDALLPTRSSRLPGTAGPACMSLHGVAPDRVYSDGRLARRRVSSYLTFPPSPARGRQSISVALFLGSPPAGVTRYPCPVEPGLSSQTGLSPRPRGCPARLRPLSYRKTGRLSNKRAGFLGIEFFRPLW